MALLSVKRSITALRKRNAIYLTKKRVLPKSQILEPSASCLSLKCGETSINRRKMKRGNNEKWKEFENRVSAKRNKTEKKDMNMLYQRTLLFKECQLFHLEDSRNSSLWTQEILFHLQNLLSFHLKTLKKTCEKYYRAPDHSCDVLASDRGPSCTRVKLVERVKRKKSIFYRIYQCW